MGPWQAGALPVLIAGVLTSARDALGPVCAKPPSAMRGYPLAGLKGKLGDPHAQHLPPCSGRGADESLQV